MTTDETLDTTTDVTADATTGMNGLIARSVRSLRSLAAVPIAVLLLIVVLGLLRVSGSSIAVLSDGSTPGNSALTPRPIRSDEWAVRTPLVIRQAALGFPGTADFGMGVHDPGVLSDLPVKSLGAIARPHTWAYFVVGVERAFAFEWWLVVLGPFLGIYALLAVLTRSRSIAALSGLIAAAAPAATWWTIPAMGLSVLYGGVATALLISALRANGARRYVLGALGGWVTAAFVSLVYLPWIIPFTLLFGAVIVSQLFGRMRPWRPFVLLVATAGGVLAVLMAIYYREHHQAANAIANSVYPGKRVGSAGQGSLALGLDAPFDSFTTAHAITTINGTNESEAASGLALWLPIVIAGGAFTGFRTRVAAHRALTALMIVTMALVAWAYLPVPAALGAVIGLTRVESYRLAYPLAVASAIAAGLWVHRYRTDPRFRPSNGRIGLAVAAFAFGAAWSGIQYTIDNIAPSRANVLLFVLAFTAAVAFVLRGRIVFGLGGASALLLFGAVRVNPIQIGLAPVTANALTHQIEAVRAGDATSRWAYIGQDFAPNALLMASGAPLATGVSWYADPAFWHRLDPASTVRPTWDRYAIVTMQVDDSISGAQLELASAVSVVIHTSTCSGALQDLEVRYVVADASITSPCLKAIDTPLGPGQRFIYEVVVPE